MSQDRLIIPKRPSHRKHRFVAAVAVCGLAVAGVWGWQMKMTFDHYAQERAAQNEAQQALTAAGDTVSGALEGDGRAQEIKDTVNQLQDMIEGTVREEVAKQQVLDEVKDKMEAQPEGVVAGETTEAN